MKDFKEYMDNATRLVEEGLDRCLPPEETQPSELHRAMRYSVLKGGKRLRSMLCLASCEAVGGNREKALLAALG